MRKRYDLRQASAGEPQTKGPTHLHESADEVGESQLRLSLLLLPH
jgi:hypothetical protein